MSGHWTGAMANPALLLVSGRSELNICPRHVSYVGSRNFFFTLFIDWLSLCGHTWAFSSFSERGPFCSYGARASPCCCGAQALGILASVVQHMGWESVVHRLSCSMGSSQIRDQTHVLSLEGGFLTTGTPGNSQKLLNALFIVSENVEVRLGN